MKYFNFKRYKFSTGFKNLNTLVYNFIKNYKFTYNKKYFSNFFYKTLSIGKLFYKTLSISKLYLPEFLDIRNINFKFLNKISIKRNKFLLLHLPASVVFFVFLYLAMPIFFTYDKTNIENIICKNKKLKCKILGEVSYRFFPNPRLKIKNLTINTYFEKNNFITVKNTVIKISFRNLLAKEKHQFKKIKLSNFKSNINIKKLEKYNGIFKDQTSYLPIRFSNGEITFYEDENYKKENYIAKIKNTKMSLEFFKDYVNAKLDGEYLNDKISIKLNKKKINNDLSTNIVLKMPKSSLLAKTSFSNLNDKKSIKEGNFLLKQNHNKITGIFNYKNGEVIIENSNLRNSYIDGKLDGKIKLTPFFDFNLNLHLNSMYFTRLYNYFLSLDKEKQKKLFRINNKINGKLSLDADKIYSNDNLVKSFESRLKFYNGNLKIEQFLINLGKIGAADLSGTLTNDNKYSNLKFESNVFIDNKKKFLRKMNLYKNNSISPNLFFAGNFDLKKIHVSFYEISEQKILNIEDVNYIENEFNDFILEVGFKYLFNFKKFKIFLKSIVEEDK
jgi:hypothetical protein